MKSIAGPRSLLPWLPLRARVPPRSAKTQAAARSASAWGRCPDLAIAKRGGLRSWGPAEATASAGVCYLRWSAFNTCCTALVDYAGTSSFVVAGCCCGSWRDAGHARPGSCGLRVRRLCLFLCLCSTGIRHSVRLLGPGPRSAQQAQQAPRTHRVGASIRPTVRHPQTLGPSVLVELFNLKALPPLPQKKRWENSNLRTSKAGSYY